MGSIDTFVLALFRLSLGSNLFLPASIVSPPPPPRLFHFIFSPPPPSSDAIDPAPLLLSGDENEGSNSYGGGEQRSDWAYSKPIVVLDIVWNSAFVSVAGAILVMARNEHPIMPLRVWLLGYVLQCVLHMVCVLVEYRRRNRARNNRTPRSRSSSSSSSMEEDALGSRRNSHEENRSHSVNRANQLRPVSSFLGSCNCYIDIFSPFAILSRLPRFLSMRRNRVTNNRTPRSRSSSSSSSMEEDALGSRRNSPEEILIEITFKTHVTRTVAIQLTELTSLVQTTILIFGGSS
ncbi:hypothetical protein DY000_02025668 [Brassica cretica]|uniref:RING-type E3 ubiquitin transferase n=1 Tax=Brassica cretica TaxID=69181 RepID=A0ABQ7EIH5_BRACR|nr:hypothetical protein DY000_02025668 [Brassica cretica]